MIIECVLIRRLGFGFFKVTFTVVEGLLNSPTFVVKDSNRSRVRTFVLEDESDNSLVIGFYTLTMTPIDLKALPEKLQKKHQSSTSGGLIARLAVDERYKGKGFGEWLLIDALRKLLSASDAVEFPVVIVDAKDGAKQFYERFGFQEFQGSESKLFITIADVRASLG